MRFFRADAAFAIPELYEMLEAENFFYAIRLHSNRILQSKVAHLLKRRTWWGLRPTTCGASTATSSIRRHHGTSPGALLPRSSGIRASCSPRRLHRDQPSDGSPTESSTSTISEAPPSRISRKASRRSTGRACPARAWRRTRCCLSFMHWRTISASSCKARTFPRRWLIGR